MSSRYEIRTYSLGASGNVASLFKNRIEISILRVPRSREGQKGGPVPGLASADFWNASCASFSDLFWAYLGGLFDVSGGTSSRIRIFRMKFPEI
eukprot:6140981-Karenia_brevis.AAC.1